MSDRYPKVVVTGGIGAGKSTVTECLRRTGFEVLDADRIGHEVLEVGGPAVGQIGLLWPQVVVDGAVDRAVLGRIVFSDEEELRRLEAVTHPQIRAEIARWAGGVQGPIAVEISVPRDMVGRGWSTVVVDAPVEVRRARLLERGMDAEDVEARMRSQPGPNEWLALADHVVVNDGTVEETCSRVGRLVDELSA